MLNSDGNSLHPDDFNFCSTHGGILLRFAVDARVVRQLEGCANGPEHVLTEDRACRITIYPDGTLVLFASSVEQARKVEARLRALSKQVGASPPTSAEVIE